MSIDPRIPIGKAMDHPAEDETTEAEVEGHGRWRATEQPSDDPEADAAEVEVEGHITPLLNPDLATSRTNERLAEADNARRASDSGQTRDGGMLDKIRRRLEG